MGEGGEPSWLAARTASKGEARNEAVDMDADDDSHSWLIAVTRVVGGGLSGSSEMVRPLPFSSRVKRRSSLVADVAD
jgi:hypothetical protein